MTDLEKYQAIVQYMSARFPGFRIMPKAESRLMRAIGAVLGKLGMPDFMTNFTTTIGRTVYAQDMDYGTLAHESIHVIDDARKPIRYKTKYLFPQLPWTLLALGAIGAIFTPWAFLCLLALLFAIPWPAPGRVAIERRGYLMSAICDAHQRGVKYVRGDGYQKMRVDTFCKGAYYYMSWTRKRMERLVRADTERAIAIYEGRIVDPDYSWILPLLRA